MRSFREKKTNAQAKSLHLHARQFSEYDFNEFKHFSIQLYRVAFLCLRLTLLHEAHARTSTRLRGLIRNECFAMKELE